MIEGLSKGILERLKQEIDPFDTILGQSNEKEKVLASLLADHHLILEGPPGIGKTTMAKQVASMLPAIEVVQGCAFRCHPEHPVCPSCRVEFDKGVKLPSEMLPGSKRFLRIQGSPDLTTEDLLGDIDPTMAFKFGPQDYRAFTPGKLLRGNRGIIFFDELNRVTEKLQNALLQVLEEGTATIGAYEVDYQAKFIMIATMNPTESTGAEELSEVLMDRFDVVFLNYPENDEIEKEIIVKYGNKFEEITVPENILDKIVRIVRATRRKPWSDELERGLSVRAGISLYEKVQALTLMRGESEVKQTDIKRMAISSMVGRLKVGPDSKYYNNESKFLNELLKIEIGV
ncbi:MAG: AAA family ATPase [Desulfitobacteriaceae bacterium]